MDDLTEQIKKLSQAKAPPPKVGPDGKPVGPGQGAGTGKQASDPLSFAGDGGHWVTIGEGEEPGHRVHVFITDKGTITKGPAPLVGGNVAHLGDHPLHHHPAGHEPVGARSHPDHSEEEAPAPLTEAESRNGLARARAAASAPAPTRGTPLGIAPKPLTHPDRIRRVRTDTLRPSHVQGQDIIEGIRDRLDRRATDLPIYRNGTLADDEHRAVQDALNRLPEAHKHIIAGHRVRYFAGGQGAEKTVSPDVARSMRQANVHGVYDPAIKEVHLHPLTFAKREAPYTALHESGHALDDALGHLRSAQDGPSADVRAGKKDAHLLSRSKTVIDLAKAHKDNAIPVLRKTSSRPDEFFADAYALYHTRPDSLKEHAPKVYNYMRGIEQEGQERVERIAD